MGLLPIGYHDGLRRCEEAPIAGAVSMDLTIVDLTGLPGRRGDRVVCARVTRMSVA
ncbi:MAG: alanine racemase C-terminal domain-containing protein [Thermoanaerobaculia bacterium]